MCMRMSLLDALTCQHAMVLDIFEVETEDEHERHRPEVGGEDETPVGTGLPLVSWLEYTLNSG